MNALFAKNFDHISWFPTFVLTPLTYLGGVFYSITMLPAWAQVVSHVNPILYMVSAFRYGFLGSTDVDLGLAYGIMIGSAAFMFALAVVLLNRGGHPGVIGRRRAREPVGGAGRPRIERLQCAYGPVVVYREGRLSRLFQGVE